MKNKFLKLVPVITLITYSVMILMNALANIIPINGLGTGEVSDSYANLFAPAGITFAIWGVIYLLLLGYTLYQLTYYKSKDEASKQLFVKIGIIFSISSIANSIWIVVWHYGYISISLMMMTIILVALIIINLMLRKRDLNSLEKIFVRLPFTVYLGWITVATIANVTTYLVATNWDRAQFSEVLWTVIILLIGALIGSVATVFYKSTAYGLVILWAYTGIAIKHLSLSGYNGAYVSIIITIFASMVLLVMAEIFVVIKKIQEKKQVKLGELK